MRLIITHGSVTQQLNAIPPTRSSCYQSVTSTKPLYKLLLINKLKVFFRIFLRTMPNAKPETILSYVPHCSNTSCVNGPPTIESYALCSECTTKCPNVYSLNIRSLPDKWKSPPTNAKEAGERRKGMKQDSVTVLCVQLLTKYRSDHYAPFQRLWLEPHSSI